MQEIKRLADQLQRAYEGEAWHGPALRELLAGVTAEKAIQKPLAQARSIWEIVLHIAAWEKAVRRRLAGEVVALSNLLKWQLGFRLFLYGRGDVNDDGKFSYSCSL